MDNTTALFIRACKSLNPKVRVQSVYRRFYNGSLPASYDTLNYILGSICEEYNLISILDMMDRLNPTHYLYYPHSEPISYAERCNRTLMSTIRHAPVSDLVNLPIARKFRRG